MYITTDSKGSQSEGSITLVPNRNYEGLAGFGSSVSLAEPVSFATSCSNSDLQVKMATAGAATITLVNSNDITANLDSAAEAMNANSSYSATIKIKAGADTSFAKHGAVLLAQFDRTYVQDVDVPALSSTGIPTFPAYLNSSDGSAAFLIPGDVADGQQVEYSFQVDTAAATPGEDQANVHWFVIDRNYDIDQETLQVIGPAVEDEDNNQINLTSANVRFYTS